MRKSIAALILFFAMSGTSTPAKADAPTAARASILVVPFRNAGGARSQDYMQLGLPLILSERLEGLPGYDVAGGPLVLTQESAALEPKAIRSKTVDLDLAAADTAAAQAGASYFVTGTYEGAEWDWNLEVRVYAVGSAPKLLASRTVHGDLTVTVPRKQGKPLRLVSMEHIHALLADAASQAFAASGLPAAKDVHDVLMPPSTKDSWAFIQFCHAIQRHWNPQDLRHHRTALEIAEYAVRVDPTYVEAQRFYAVLLEKDGKAIKARLHYELALAKRPNDVRVLMRLGAIELGAGNAEVAKVYLTKATAAKPLDAETHARLAEADIKLGDPDAAVKEYETVRGLAPRRLSDRKALSALYCAKGRHADAAKEYQAIVDADPADPEAAFLLGAALRRTGDAAGASKAYDAASVRFPKEKRFARYRDGLSDVDALVASVAKGKALSVEIDARRTTYQAAVNDATLDFSIHGKEACAQGRGASSALFAQDQLARYGSGSDDLLAVAATVKTSLDKGDAAVLTPDEAADAKALADAVLAVPRDRDEMRSQFARTLRPLADKAGCTADVLKGMTADTITVVETRDEDRQVPIADVKPMPGPVIIAEPARVIRFTVDNVRGSEDYAVVLDGVELGTVPTGSASIFTATVGNHSLCLVPKAPICGNEGTVRTVFLHEGWSLTVKPGRGS